MPSATDTFYHSDIPRAHRDAWKLIRKAERQAMLALKTGASAEDARAKAVKLARRALRSLPGELVPRYGGNRLANAIFERAEAKYYLLKGPPKAAPQRPESVEDNPTRVRLTIKIPPAHKRNLNTGTAQSPESSSSSSGPERSEPGYRTQRVLPYRKPAGRTRAPRDRAPYRNSEGAVDALASVLQCARISNETAAARPPIDSHMRTVPAGYNMDDLSAALAGSNFSDTAPAPVAPAYVGPASSSPEVALHVAPAHSPPSDFDSANAKHAHAVDWTDARRLKSRRAILPVDSVSSPAARRREGRFNPLDRSARGTERTKERS